MLVSSLSHVSQSCCTQSPLYNTQLSILKPPSRETQNILYLLLQHLTSPVAAIPILFSVPEPHDKYLSNSLPHFLATNSRLDASPSIWIVTTMFKNEQRIFTWELLDTIHLISLASLKRSQLILLANIIWTIADIAFKQALVVAVRLCTHGRVVQGMSALGDPILGLSQAS